MKKLLSHEDHQRLASAAGGLVISEFRSEATITAMSTVLKAMSPGTQFTQRDMWATLFLLGCPHDEQPGKEWRPPGRNEWTYPVFKRFAHTINKFVWVRDDGVRDDEPLPVEQVNQTFAVQKTAAAPQNPDPVQPVGPNPASLNDVMESDYGELCSTLFEGTGCSAAPEPLEYPSYTHDYLSNPLLIEEVVRRVRWKFPLEQVEEVRSLVGYYFARWSATGYCDKYILAGKPPTVGALATWIHHKMTQEIYKQGTNPLSRMKGARTQGEHREAQARKAYYTHPDAIKSLGAEGPQVVYTRTEDGQAAETIFVCPADVELAEAEAEEADLTARVRKGVDRGGELRAVAEAMGADSGAFDRFIQVQQGLRSSRRKSAEDVQFLQGVLALTQRAMRALEALDEEPFSTPEELKLGADDSRFLLTGGWVEAHQGGSLLLTPKGRDAIERETLFASDAE